MEQGDDFNTVMVPPSTQQKKPVLSWGLKIKRKLKVVVPFLAKFRPPVGQCCDQCSPLSLDKKSGLCPPSLGFQNLLGINETHTRYRGWLVRRVCCMLFVNGCKVYPSPVTNRMERICKSNRVQEALTALPEVEEDPERHSCLSPYLSLINTCISPRFLRFVGWAMLKILGSVFCSVQVNLNHLAALHRETQKGSVLVYVCVHQSIMDHILISLVLFCHNLRVPYTLCPLQISCSWLRLILQKLGVILLPPGMLTEQDAQMDSLYSPVMTTLVCELLGEGQALSMGVSRQSGGGGQWLALISQLITDGAVSDVSLVPVGIAYDCVPKADFQIGLSSALRTLYSALCGGWRGCVRIHFAQPFSLKEICRTGRCRVDGWRPLQELLLPVILTNSTDSIFGQRLTSWLLPPRCVPQLVQSERDLGLALILHLIYSTTSCMAVMSTSVMSGLLLHRHRKGVYLSALCRDVVWLIEEVLLRDMDVGFGGSLVEVVYHSLRHLTPHLIIAGIPSRKDPFIIPRPSLSATLSLSQHTHILTHTFILEAVGACSVSAMLCDVAGSGIGSGVRSAEVGGDEAKADVEFDVALCQTELTERALQLCHLLPPGFMPPCQSANGFAVEAVDSLVRCGVLIMEEVLRDAPACDAYKKLGTLSWSASDDPYHDESDSEDGESRFYKLSQPSQCPEMLLFLCSLLSGHLRALRSATQGLDLLHTPLPEAVCVAQIHSHLCNMAHKDRWHYESCSEEVARTAVRTLIDLGVIVEEQQGSGMFLSVSPCFQLADNQQKLQCFISQYIYD